MSVIDKIKDIFSKKNINSVLETVKSSLEKQKNNFLNLSWRLLKLYEQQKKKFIEKGKLTIEQIKKIKQIEKLRKEILIIEEKNNKNYFQDDDIEVLDEWWDEIDDVYTIIIPKDTNKKFWEKNFHNFIKNIENLEWIWEFVEEDIDIFYVNKKLCKMTLEQLKVEILYLYMKYLLDFLKSKFK